ncbi:uncharacterized protein LOC129749441 isoform X2 [Uranotaenia lowii]|nr:uncharacterized protein LOC129749441 isoform X2 [Uranotaenia lowii]
MCQMRFFEKATLRIDLIGWDDTSKATKYLKWLMVSTRPYRHLHISIVQDKWHLVPRLVHRFSDSLTHLTLENTCPQYPYEIEKSVLQGIFESAQRLVEFQVFGYVRIVISNPCQKISFPQLTHLERLYMDRHAFHNTNYNWAAIAPNLRDMHISLNTTCTSYLEMIRSFSQTLEGLGLVERDRQAFFRALGNIRFPKVQRLVVDSWENPLPDQARKFFDRFEQITHLDYGLKLSLPVLNILVEKFQDLETIRLRNDFPKEVFTGLAKLPHLKEVSFRTDHHNIVKLVVTDPLHQMQKLSFNHCASLEDQSEFFQQLSQNAPVLTSLELNRLNKSHTLDTICRSFPSLRSLVINWQCKKLTTKSFLCLNTLNNLEHLGLRCDFQTRPGYSWVYFPVCPSIRSLFLSIRYPRFDPADAEEQEDHEWETMGHKFSSLAMLKLSECEPRIRPRQLATLRWALPRYCKIDIGMRPERMFPQMNPSTVPEVVIGNW